MMYSSYNCRIETDLKKKIVIGVRDIDCKISIYSNLMAISLQMAHDGKDGAEDESRLFWEKSKVKKGGRQTESRWDKLSVKPRLKVGSGGLEL